MLRRGGLWERGFSSQSVGAQAAARKIEETYTGTYCVWEPARRRLGAKQRYGQLAAPYLRNVFDVRSSAKTVTGFTPGQALFPNMAVLGNRGKQTKCATPPPLAARLSILSDGGKATSQIHHKATTKLHGGRRPTGSLLTLGHRSMLLLLDFTTISSR
jgi:hypothetical protein